MQALHEQQKQGEVPEMMTANKNSKYQIKAIEKHLVHVSLQIPGFDGRTGRAQHKPFVQSFYPDKFGLMDKQDAFKGYIAEIIHDPRSEKEIADDLANDKGGSKVDQAGKEKPISRMNKAELVTLYKELYGEDPVADLGAEELRKAIEEKRGEGSKEK